MRAERGKELLGWSAVANALSLMLVDAREQPRADGREQVEELVQSMFDTFDADLVDMKMKYRDRIGDFAVHPIMEIYLGRQTMDG